MNALSNNLFILISVVVDWGSAEIEQSKGVAFSYSWTSNLICIVNAAIGVTSKESRWPASGNSIRQTEADHGTQKEVEEIDNRGELARGGAWADGRKPGDRAPIPRNGPTPRDGAPAQGDGAPVPREEAIVSENGAPTPRVRSTPGDRASALGDGAPLLRNAVRALGNEIPTLGDGPAPGNGRFDGEGPDCSFLLNVFTRASFLALRL